MNVAFLVGLRFAMGQKSTAFLSFITRVSILGLTLGVMALVIVVSVMNGFDSQLKYRILGAVPHLVIEGEPFKHPLAKGMARFLHYEGMMLVSGEGRLIAVYGIDPEQESDVSIIPQHLRSGVITDLKSGEFRVIVGSSLASRFSLWTGSKSTLLIPVPSSGGETVVPRISQVTVLDTFKLDSELDYGLVLMHVDDLARITGDERVLSRVALNDIFSVNAFLQASGAVVVETWYDEYGDFFETVRMEKLMMFLLLTLIVMIAAFNTVSGLSMMVQEKQSEIAVLRTMGLSRGEVTSIFVVQGALIGVVGVSFGLLLGTPLAHYITEIVSFFENVLGNRMLAGTYFDRVPSDVRYADIAVIALVSFLIALLATLYPAFRAARIDPAVVLRAE
jgi:lipoprotein-releasing system permease protein